MVRKRHLQYKLENLREEVEDIRGLTGKVYPRRGWDGKDYHQAGILASTDYVNGSIANLIDLIPECWEVTSYKSSERPPEQLFKVRNRLTDKEAFGATEEEAKAAARWSPQ